MCSKTKKSCRLLGADPSEWSKYEPLPAPAVVTAGFEPFQSAIKLAAQGDRERARRAIAEIDGAAIREWYIEHAQISGTRRLAVVGRQARPKPDVDRDKVRYPSPKLAAEVYLRDGYRCRYCQRRIVTRELLKALHAVVGGESFPMGSTNATRHGAALAYRAVADHVIPRSMGGPTSAGNLATACYPCNFGKAEYTLDELRLLAPRPPLLDGWDGLQPLLPALRAHRAVL